jgi:phage protein U
MRHNIVRPESRILDQIKELPFFQTEAFVEGLRHLVGEIERGSIVRFDGRSLLNPRLQFFDSAQLDEIIRLSMEATSQLLLQGYPEDVGFFALGQTASEGKFLFHVSDLPRLARDVFLTQNEPFTTNTLPKVLQSAFQAACQNERINVILTLSRMDDFPEVQVTQAIPKDSCGNTSDVIYGSMNRADLSKVAAHETVVNIGALLRGKPNSVPVT